MTSDAPPPAELAHPQIRLEGEVNETMLRTFRDALAAVEARGETAVLEITTPGGDADIGRRIATDIRLHRERTGRDALFLGKAVVYSAGVTIMSGFPRHARWLAHGAVLLIHGRSLGRTVTFDGPLQQERKRLEALLAEVDTGLALERRGFETLIQGSAIGIDELLERAQSNWYVDADEALARGLVEGLV